jgi:hypothetical protein
MINQFNDWFQSKLPDVRKVQDLLMVQLSNEPQQLIDDLTEVEAWASRCGELLAESNAWLDRAKLFYQPEKTEDLRESDRKAYVDSQVSDIRKVRDIMDSLCDCIKNRLILGESILRMQSIFREPSLKQILE